MEKVTVKLLPEGKEIPCNIGDTLLDVLRGADGAWNFPCGGHGTCGKCRVKIHEGSIHAPTEEESNFLSQREVEDGIRLACFTRISGNLVLSAPEKETKHQILTSGEIPKINLNPTIVKKYIGVDRGSLARQKSLEELITGVLGTKVKDKARLAFLQGISQELLEGFTAIIAGEEVVGVEPGNTKDRCFGVAVDIGTTTVVAALIDMLTGEELCNASSLNPQQEFGLDVLTRIEFVRKETRGREKLQKAIIGCLNSLLQELCIKSGVKNTEIYEVSIAANTTMVHLLLGVNPQSIGAIPYQPVVRRGINVPAKEIGIKISPYGSVYTLPAVSGYIGGDIVAGIMATRMKGAAGSNLLIDIGTNGEIVLQRGERITACSSPAGPALEGMNIAHGMRAAEGAIERVEIDENVTVETIGGKPPVGICGSGIIDMVAEMLKTGVVEKSGRMADADKLRIAGKAGLAGRMVKIDGQKAFCLVDKKDSGQQCLDDIMVYAKDVRQVQLAKGALWSGIAALLNEEGVSIDQIDTVYIAGAFGTHVRVESLARLGIISKKWVDKVRFVGNTAKAGAAMCLLSREEKEKAEQIAETVSHFELAMRPEFDRLFTGALKFC